MGLAVGDALGTTLEFQTSPKMLHKDIVGGGPFHVCIFFFINIYLYLK